MFRHNSHVFEPEILPRSLSATYDEPPAHAPSSSSSACTRRPRSAIVVQGLHGVGKSTLVNTLLGTVPLCPSRFPCPPCPSSEKQPQQNLFSKAVEPATMESCVRKPSFVIQCYGKTTDCGTNPTTVRQPTWVTDMLSPMPPHQQQQEQQGDEQVSRVYSNTGAAPSVEGKLSLYGAMPMAESSSLHSRCLSDAQLRQYERHEHSGDTARIEEQRAKFLVGVTPARTTVHTLPLSADAGGCRRLAASSVLALRTAVDDIWTTYHSERPSDLCCSPTATEASFLVVDLRLKTASVPEDEAYKEEVVEEEPDEGCTTTIVESQTVEERPAMHLAHTMVYVVTDDDVPMLAEIRRRRQEEEARQVEGRSCGNAPQRPSSPLLAGSLSYASDSRRSAVLSSLAAAMTTRSTACRSIVVVNVRSLLLSRPVVSPAADRSAFAPEDDASAASSFDMCDTPRLPATTPTTTTTTLRCPQECFTSTELDAARDWISRHWRVPLEDVFLFDAQRALMSRVLGSSPSSSSSSILSSLTSATHPTTAMLEPFLEAVALQQIKAAQEYASRRRLPRQRHEASAIIPFPMMKRDVVGDETARVVELSGGTTTTSLSSKPGELEGEEGHTQSEPTKNNNSNEAPARPAATTTATDASRATGLRLRDAEAARDDHVAALLQQREAEQRAAALENRRQAEERLRDPQRRPGEQRYVPVVMRK